MADPAKGARLDRATRTLTLSRILLWFSDDFDSDRAADADAGSDGDGDAVTWAIARLPRDDAEWARRNARRLYVRYFDYDWNLNSQRDEDMI
jgi:hypothetical protein